MKRMGIVMEVLGTLVIVLAVGIPQETRAMTVTARAAVAGTSLRAVASAFELSGRRVGPATAGAAA
jgi:hypothetical protein